MNGPIRHAMRPILAGVCLMAAIAACGDTGKPAGDPDVPRFVQEQDVDDLVHVDDDDGEFWYSPGEFWYSPGQRMVYAESCDLARAATGETGEPYSGFGFLCPNE